MVQPMVKSPCQLALESGLQEKFPTERWNLGVVSKSAFGAHLPRGGRELRGGEGSTQALWNTGMEGPGRR